MNGPVPSSSQMAPIPKARTSSVAIGSIAPAPRNAMSTSSRPATVPEMVSSTASTASAANTPHSTAVDPEALSR